MYEEYLQMMATETMFNIIYPLVSILSAQQQNSNSRKA